MACPPRFFFFFDFLSYKMHEENNALILNQKQRKKNKPKTRKFKGVKNYYSPFRFQKVGRCLATTLHFDRVTVTCTSTFPRRMLRAIHDRRRSPAEHQGGYHPTTSGRREPTEDAVVRPPDRVRVERTVVRRQRVENGFRWTAVTSIVVAIVVICEDEITKFRNIFYCINAMASRT